MSWVVPSLASMAHHESFITMASNIHFYYLLLLNWWLPCKIIFELKKRSWRQKMMSKQLEATKVDELSPCDDISSLDKSTKNICLPFPYFIFNFFQHHSTIPPIMWCSWEKNRRVSPKAYQMIKWKYCRCWQALVLVGEMKINLFVIMYVAGCCIYKYICCSSGTECIVTLLLHTQHTQHLYSHIFNTLSPWVKV